MVYLYAAKKITIDKLNLSKSYTHVYITHICKLVRASGLLRQNKMLTKLALSVATASRRKYL